MNELDQHRTVRLLRIFYPVWMIAGMFSIMYVQSSLIDYNNADVTAENISGNELLFRVGIVGRLVTQLLYIIIPLLLYQLFKSTNKTQALLMVILALVSVPITMHNETYQLMAIQFVKEPEMMMNYLNTYSEGMTISMLFWGLWLFPLGYLAYKSGYFPKFIGILLIIGGVGYTLGILVELLFPDMTALKSVLEVLTFGEVIFILWLVFMGVRKKQE